MKKLMMLCIIALAVAIALPAFAEVQNVKVSGDLSARAIVRRGYNLDKDATATSKTTTNYIQGAAEVQVEADMTDNVSTVVRFADQRNWGDNTGLAAGNSTNQFNLLVDLANVTLKEFVYSPLTLTIGRQDLWFGKGFIVGAKLRDPSAAISAPEYTVFNSFDAIKATLDFDPWKLDAVYSIIEENAINLNDNVTLAGVNAGYKFDSYKGEAEAYFWFKGDNGLKAYPASSSSVAVKKNSVDVIGIRGSMEPMANTTVAGEVAWQGGKYSSSSTQSVKRSALAVDLSADYKFKDVKYTPTVGGEYIYYSGAKSTSTTATSKWGGWDPMYRGKFDSAIREFQNVYYATAQREANAASTVIDQDSGASNEQQFIIMGSVKPMNSVKLDGRYAWFRAAQKITTASGTRSKDLGSELDLTLTYDYTEDVSFGLLAGWFFPGKYWISGQDDIATDIVGTVKVAF